jgi:hypothetical protein
MPAFRRAICAAAVGLVVCASGASAQAAVTTCNSTSLTPTDVLVSKCATDQNGGTGNVVFRHHGLTVKLRARTHWLPEQVGMSWSSDGPVTVPANPSTGQPYGQICVQTEIMRQRLQGSAFTTQQLVLSYNGAVHPQALNIGDGIGSHEYCGAVPADATNVYWQMLSTVVASEPCSRATEKERLIGVAFKD